jgi:hypothetical protein
MAYTAIHQSKEKGFRREGNGEESLSLIAWMFITELDRLKVPEDRIALLVGHERGVQSLSRLTVKGLHSKSLLSTWKRSILTCNLTFSLSL